MFDNLLHLSPLLLLFLPVLYAIYQLYLSPLCRVPGPRLAALSPFLGFRMDRHPYETLFELHKQYGLVVRVGPDEVSISSVNDLPKVYGARTELPKAPVYDAFRAPHALGPMFSMRDKTLHSVRRRRLLPAYSKRTILALQDWILQQADTMCDKLESETRQGKTVDLLDYFRMMSGDSALRLAFDFREDMVKNAELPPVMQQIVTEIGMPFYYYVLRMVLPFDYIPAFVWRMLPENFTYHLFSMNTIDRYSKEYLLRYLEQTKSQDDVKTEVVGRLIDQIDPITQQPLSVDELAGEARSVILAGSDTVANTAAYAAWLMLDNNDIMSRVREELRTIDVQETAPTELFDKLESLPFFSACIYETLRLYPSIPGLLAREVSTSGLVIGDYALPPGTIIGASALVIHRSEKELWGPDVDRFYPERWLKSTEEIQHMRRNLVTFGLGSRKCVGQQMAIVQLHTVLFRLFMRFNGEKVSSAEDMRPIGSFNLIPQGEACLMRLHIQN